MAAQYGFGPFADDSRISDATAKGLVQAGRVQIRWREAGSSGPSTADTGLAAYDTTLHAFTADLKAPRRAGRREGPTPSRSGS